MPSILTDNLARRCLPYLARLGQSHAIRGGTFDGMDITRRKASFVAWLPTGGRLVSRFTPGKTEEACLIRIFDRAQATMRLHHLREHVIRTVEPHLDGMTNETLEVLCDWLKDRGLQSEVYDEMDTSDCQLILHHIEEIKQFNFPHISRS